MNGSFSHTSLRNGINVYHYPTAKFKTNTIRVFVHTPLSRETVTRVALIPAVLKRGCAGFETTREISRHLDNLYGARFDAGVFKLGDSHVIQVGLEIGNPRYLGTNEDLLARGMDFMGRVVFEPISDGRSFRKEYVDQEKDVLSREIASIINEKSRYATIRCVQEMFRSEPFGVHELGFTGDIPGIDGEGLHSLYGNIIQGSPIDLCIAGDVDESRAVELAERTFGRAAPRSSTSLRTMPAGRATGPRVVTEEQDIAQGKLCLGYSADLSAGDGLYPMMFYDGIFGGFVHSKLFINVREKASLAYYASSSLNPIKGFLLVAAGIDFDKYGDALEIIKKQADDISKGDVSDTEMDYTKKALINRFRSWDDSPGAKIASFLELLAIGRPETTEERIKRVNEVTRDQVIAAAQGVALDTVYFLRNGR